jgi:hypothetical protein
MGIGSALKNLLPNPYSRKESLASFIKKTSSISTEIDLGSTIVEQIIWLAIIIGTLYFILDILKLFLLIIFLIGLLIISINFVLSFSRIKSIRQIDPQTDSFSSWKILLINGYYDTLVSGISAMANVLGAFSFIYILDSGLINFKLDPYAVPYIKYFLFLLIIFRVYGFIIRFIKYKLVKKIPKSDNIAELYKNCNLINVLFSIVGNIVTIMVMVLITAYLLFSGIFPREIIRAYSSLIIILFPFFVFIILFLIYNIFTYKKLKGLDLTSQEFNLMNQRPDAINQTSVLDNKQVSQIDFNISRTTYPNEKILGSFFGLERVVATFKDIFSGKTGSYEFLGVGRNYSPENALLITNYRMLFIQVPATGGDKVIMDTDFTWLNMMFNRSEIIKNGEKLLKNDSIIQILPLIKNEVLYRDINTIILNKFSINIKKMNGEKFRYYFIDKEYIEIIDRILHEYLGARFIRK